MLPSSFRSFLSSPVLPGAVVLLTAVLVGGAALAQEHGRGFVPPENWERILEERRRVFPVDKTPTPESWDWRTMEGVTTAKDQGQCGSCWAFAAAGEMEAKIKIYYGEVLNLSEQQIISCNPYGNGCGGGWAGAAYYVFQHYGGVTEDCMPYEGSDDVPCTQSEHHKFTSLDNWYSVSNNVDQIKQAVMEGPVCTSVDADAGFDGYTGGCITMQGSGTNHLILIVGWNDRACNETGAWIIKNSWGPGWGDAGFGYIQYGAASIGSGVTALNYTPPGVEVRVNAPDPGTVYYGEEDVTIEWLTVGEPAGAVDIWFGTEGYCGSTLVAENVTNPGSFQWTLPNVTTDRATFLVFPSEGTHRGFGFSNDEMTVIGYQTRYVSSAGSNTFPFDSPTKAAHSIADAVLAGAGRDTVKIAGGDYMESVAVNSQCVLVGGFSPDFAVRDPEVHITRLRGVNGCLRFSQNAGDHCGVMGVTFYDCTASIGAVPENGRHGAAIFSSGASPLIADCVFENNRANPSTDSGWGGAIMAHQGSPTVRDCGFTGNVGSRGGAIALSEAVDAVVEDCTFTGNACSDSTSDLYTGGAVYVAAGSATLRRCTVENNGGTGYGGGVAVANGAQLSLEDCDLTGNRSWLGGGGIHHASGGLVAVGGRWADNSTATGHGGGLQAGGGDISLRNITLLDNQAAELGGGILAMGIATGTVEHCVLDGNTAGQNGGGMMVFASSDLIVRHNVVTLSTGGGLMASSPSLVSDYNLAWQNAGGDFLSVAGPHDRVADPVYSDAASDDFAPGLHSPCVDLGDPDPACQDPDGSRADLGQCGGPDAVPVAPVAVTGADASSLGGGVYRITWETSPAVDLAEYAVYRDTAEVFVPAVDKLVALVAAGTTQVDDTPQHDGTYYLVAAVDTGGHMGGYSNRAETEMGPVAAPEPGLPRVLGISRVVPNPFNPRTTVRFDVPKAARIQLSVYDLRGRLVRELHDGTLPAGSHTVTWNGDDRGGRTAAAGVYFIRLSDGRSTSTVKAVLAK